MTDESDPPAGEPAAQKELSCGERCPRCAEDDIHTYCDKPMNHGGYHKDWKWHEW